MKKKLVITLCSLFLVCAFALVAVFAATAFNVESRLTVSFNVGDNRQCSVVAVLTPENVDGYTVPYEKTGIVKANSNNGELSLDFGTLIVNRPDSKWTITITIKNSGSNNMKVNFEVPSSVVGNLKISEAVYNSDGVVYSDANCTTATSVANNVYLKGGSGPESDDGGTLTLTQTIEIANKNKPVNEGSDNDTSVSLSWVGNFGA